MATATITITTRTRGLRRARALLRLASLLRSIRIAQAGLDGIRIDYRIGRAGRWQPGPRLGLRARRADRG